MKTDHYTKIVLTVCGVPDSVMSEKLSNNPDSTRHQGASHECQP